MILITVNYCQFKINLDMSRSAVQLRQIIWRTMTDPTACMVSEICALVAALADGPTCCFDVWFAAQFLRDKCTAADFGLPRFHERQRGTRSSACTNANSKFGLSLVVILSSAQSFAAFTPHILHQYAYYARNDM